MSNTEFKKFDEYVKSKNEDIDVDLDKLMSESFYSIDEGIFANIKNMGFIRGLKLSIGKGIVGFMNLIKEDPRMQKKLSEFIGKIGDSAAKDLGDIVGNMTSKLQTENEELKRRLAEAEKLRYDFEK